MTLETPTFELPGGGRVIFCTRAEGNMSSVAGDGKRAGLRVIARGRQVHGAVVARVRQPSDRMAGESPGELPEADGHATAAHGVGVMVLTADCLPIALGCGGAVAMLHAGWRGIAAGVLQEGVRALHELAGGEHIEAVIGPGAGSCCYEVGPEVHAALGGDAQRGRIDLSAHARERLQRMGVARVREMRACTICDQRFFSHRRERERAGRQAALAWLP